MSNQNKKDGTSNIVPMHQSISTSSSNDSTSSITPDYDRMKKMKDGGNGGGSDMDPYVKKEELNNALKIQELELSAKISDVKNEMEKSFIKVDKSFSDLKLELEKQHKTNVRWIIGTAIAVAGVLVTAVALL